MCVFRSRHSSGNTYIVQALPQCGWWSQLVPAVDDHHQRILRATARMSSDALLRSVRDSDHRSVVRAAYAQSTLCADLVAFEAVARSAFSNVIAAAHSSGGRMAASVLGTPISRVEVAQRPWRVPPQYLEAVIVAALAATTTDRLAEHDYAVQTLQDEGMGSVTPAANPGLRLSLSIAVSSPCGTL